MSSLADLERAAMDLAERTRLARNGDPIAEHDLITATDSFLDSTRLKTASLDLVCSVLNRITWQDYWSACNAADVATPPTAADGIEVQFRGSSALLKLHGPAFECLKSRPAPRRLRPVTRESSALPADPGGELAALDTIDQRSVGDSVPIKRGPGMAPAPPNR